LVNARLTASGRISRDRRDREAMLRQAQRDTGSSKRDVWIDGQFIEVDVYQRDALSENARIEGPAIVEEYDSTTYVAPGWSCKVEGDLLVQERGRR
ncbi:MAG TPA: hypothetical protein VIW73_10100, partial [Candidatus Cybelea sp.]